MRKIALILICLLTITMTSGCDIKPTNPKDNINNSTSTFGKEPEAEEQSFWRDVIGKRKDNHLQDLNETFFFPQQNLSYAKKRSYIRVENVQRTCDDEVIREWGSWRAYWDCQGNRDEYGEDKDGRCSLRRCDRCDEIRQRIKNR